MLFEPLVGHDERLREEAVRAGQKVRKSTSRLTKKRRRYWQRICRNWRVGGVHTVMLAWRPTLLS